MQLGQWMKILCVIGLLASGTSDVLAQIGIGPRTGVGFYYRSNDNENPEPVDRLGLHVGAVVDFGLNSLLTLQTEFGYAQKGWRQGFENLNREYRIDYLEGAALLKLRIGGKFGIQAMAGPYVGLGLNITETVEAFGQEEENQLDFDDTVLESTDFGGLLGAGVYLKGARSQFFLDLRGAVGFTDLWEGELETYSRALTINTGVLFAL